ncbi:MAG: hypothetical protein ABFD75_06360 [Smithella sp.]
MPPRYALNATWYDGLVKRLDAALRFIPCHCGVRQVLLVPHDLRALPAAFRCIGHLPKFLLPRMFGKAADEDVNGMEQGAGLQPAP